ncbi:hypothetical protein [Paraliomyxa miuraensis]|uniref:hypothetical protein n=1 Tax=Paraliomyxa miuraensis TaxID=376150 RepID=UPI0022563234|nr:hypothetical protein [Paraliomyxa miuraensis]MCX4246730.1 hypothetical protein [Paraliomyxa miuraensis]
MSSDDPSETGLLAQLPAEARASFSRILANAVRSPIGLREQLPLYLQAIERASTQGGPPAELGRAIARDCEALLDAWDGFDEAGQRLARAAVEYFLLCRDGDDDLASPEGLDDDAAVVSLVRAHLGV